MIPMASRHGLSETSFPSRVPRQFLQEDVFRRVNVKPCVGIRRYPHALSAVHLRSVEGGTDHDEQIDLGRCLAVDHVGAGSLADGLAKGVGIDVG